MRLSSENRSCARTAPQCLISLTYTHTHTHTQPKLTCVQLRVLQTKVRRFFLCVCVVRVWRQNRASAQTTKIAATRPKTLRRYLPMYSRSLPLSTSRGRFFLCVPSCAVPTSMSLSTPQVSVCGGFALCVCAHAVIFHFSHAYLRFLKDARNNDCRNDGNALTVFCAVSHLRLFPTNVCGSVY